ncbi:T9SS type A sorting domain-containing protein [Saprospiraceae bacterium]|nr:T9SS type A sorting domain-containing protein [Saprospiraceae bacterium]
MKKVSLFVLAFILSISACYTQVTSLPLLQISDLQYEGAFTIPGDDFGVSNANYGTGTLAFNKVNNSLFLGGFELHGAVAEFSIPPLVNSTDLSDLNNASILQDFRSVLDGTPDSNPQNIDRVTGIYLLDNHLIINGMEYYDAPADNTLTTLSLTDASKLASSDVNGYFSLAGVAHAAGWISDIPSDWQSLLGGTHLAGNSSKYPINSRLPMGISAFSFTASDIISTSTGNISTTPLMDFDLTNPLYDDLSTYADANYNLVKVNGSTFPGHTVDDADIVVGQNTMWTELSQASYGFIVPGTRTYLTLGSSGGHNSGIGYKPQQSDGNVCGGPCSYDANDSYNYYWLWDVNDLLAVKNGTMIAHAVRPYAYGEFTVPFQSDVYYDTEEFHEIVGGAYDADANLLYLSIYDGASTGPYDVRPVIVAYSINNLISSIAETEKNTTIKILPNPTKNTFRFSIDQGIFKELSIYSNIGQHLKKSSFQEVDISELESGLYHVRFRLTDGSIVTEQLIVD